MYPNLITDLLQPKPQGVVHEFGLILLNSKDKKRNLPCHPFSACLGRDIGGKLIYSCRTKALEKAKQEGIE